MAKRIIFIFLTLLLFEEIATSQHRKRILIDKEIEVPRGESKEFHFLVPEGNKWQFDGSFKTSGGFNDDINLLVMNQQNYVRWYSHYDYDPALKIERKKEGKFTIDAEPGQTYYFVFDNFFSTVSNKKVKVKLELVPIQ